jgi:hypothetical protein
VAVLVIFIQENPYPAGLLIVEVIPKNLLGQNLFGSGRVCFWG